MNFGEDNAYGQVGEELVRRYGELMVRGEVGCEVKRKRRPDFTFYVEQAQQSQGGEGPERPGGVEATQAPLFAYVLADTGIVVVFPTDLLREAAGKVGTPTEQPARHEGNPTRGTLLGLVAILDRYEPDRSGWPVPAGGWKEVEEIV